MPIIITPPAVPLSSPTVDAFTDELLNTSAVIIGSWVKIVNNATSNAYVSSAATDSAGHFTIAAPAGTYTTYTGPSSAGPWTPTGNYNYVVANTVPVFNVMDYGAKGDGATDDTTAIQAAITAMPASGGKLLFPNTSLGANYLTGQINLNKPCILQFDGVTLTGKAAAATMFQVTANDVSLIGTAIFNGNSTAVQFMGSGTVGGLPVSTLIIDGDFQISGFTTNGFNLFRPTNLRIRGIKGNNQPQMIYTNGGNHLVIQDIYLNYTTNQTTVPIDIVSNQALTEPNDVVLERVFIDGTGAGGATPTAIVIGTNPGQVADSITVRSCRVSNWPIDSIDIIRGRNTVMDDFKAINSGVISLMSQGMKISNSLAWHSSGSGFVFGDPTVVAATSDIVVTNCQAIGCGTAHSGNAQRDRAGFVFVGNASLTVTNCQMTGCEAWDDGGGNQLYGVSVYAYSSNIYLRSNLLSNNVTAAVYTGSTAVSNVVRSFNVGDTTGFTAEAPSVINWTQAMGAQTLYGAGNGTGLTSANGSGPLKLEASQSGNINDTAHDYNIGALVNNWTADAAGITMGNAARGDGIYMQATDTSGFVGPANALNVFAGTAPQQTIDSGSGGTVTYTATTLVDTSKSWTTNQWVNRYVVTGAFGLTAVVMFITSNTATTLTGTGGWLVQVGSSQAALQATSTPANGTAYQIPNSNATGINIQRFSSGSALKISSMANSGGAWSGAAGGSDYVIQVNQAGGVNSTVLGLADNGTTTGDTAVFSSASKTSGNLLKLFHATSAFTGSGIQMNFGTASGTYNGTFIAAQVAGVLKWQIGADGKTYAAGGYDTVSAAALSIGPNNATSVNIVPRATFTGGTILPNNVTFQSKLNAGSVFNLFYTDVSDIIKMGGVDSATNTTLELYANSTKGLAMSTAGVVTLFGDPGLKFNVAVSRIIPGATSLSLRNNANSADNLIIVDAGDATLRGSLTMSDAKNIVLQTTTGTKIGTATTQKLGFWNVAPVIQPATTGTSTGFTAGAGTAVNDASTFTGGTGATAYRISDIVLALKQTGIMAA